MYELFLKLTGRYQPSVTEIVADFQAKVDQLEARGHEMQTDSLDIDDEIADLRQQQRDCDAEADKAFNVAAKLRSLVG